MSRKRESAMKSPSSSSSKKCCPHGSFPGAHDVQFWATAHGRSCNVGFRNFPLGCTKTSIISNGFIRDYPVSL